MHKLEELKIWHKSMDMSVMIYEATAAFPVEERYGLTSQIRRAAVSIPSNIAEGAGRNSYKEFAHFLGIANGSSYELQTQLLLACKLKLLTEAVLKGLLSMLEEVQKMNYKLQLSLNTQH